MMQNKYLFVHEFYVLILKEQESGNFVVKERQVRSVVTQLSSTLHSKSRKENSARQPLNDRFFLSLEKTKMRKNFQKVLDRER